MENINDNPVVTSVGNSWIVCRSKSHSGRIYYFNTSTGEAAWNLSEVEIEKAKNATKIIENSGVNMDGCPEPKDPPQDKLNRNIQLHKYLDNLPKIGSTKSCINKTITNIVPPSFPKNQCCIHMNTRYHNTIEYPMTCGLNPIPCNVPTESDHNNILSMMNMSRYQMDLHNNRFPNNEMTYVQATSVPLNERFETLLNVNHDIDANSSLGTSIKDNQIFIENDSSHVNVQDSNMDLRDFIARKRETKFSDVTVEPIQLINKSRLINNKMLAISKNMETNDFHQRDPADDILLQEHNSTLTRKNVLLQLKRIAKRIVHKDLWYIVPDVNTLLYHHEFIKSLVEADEECRLLVLENVLTDIRNTSRSENIDAMTHGRRAVIFISQSIKARVATIDKDPTAVNNKSKSYFLDRCSKLKENYHIILICNDDELHDHEKATHLPMFTVNEIKSFFGADVKEGGTNQGQRSQMRTNQLDDDYLQGMRITIPNNEIKLNDIEPSGSKIKPKDDDKIIMARNISTVSAGTQTSEDRRTKTTIDVGIQANLDQRLEPQTKSTQTIESSVETSSTLEKAPDILDNAGLVQRKRIKLNRSVSSPSTKKEDTGVKKNFKLRRKRIVFHVENTDTAQFQEKTAAENQSYNLTSNNISKIDDSEKQLDTNSQEPVSNDKKISEDIILEETPTSVIESNALTNQDSESKCNENVQNATSDVSDDDNKNSNCVMFEVTSQVMEDNFKTRRDEWVSRFLQIMEEVLTQLLQKDSLGSSFSPPWTVHEATQCIKTKYIKNKDIVDAADKLSEILFCCSDSKGKIDINMSSDKFMKLYSYAVYLIDSLQAIIENSEDLQIASESMAKLLNDIQNPNLDNSQNDSFNDTTIETALDVSSAATINSDTGRNVPAGSIHSPRREQPNVKNSESTPKYNLRSLWKRYFQNNMVDTSSFRTESSRQDDPESQFFTSLHLRKNDTSCDDINTPDNACDNTKCSAISHMEENETVNNEPPVDELSSQVETPENVAKIEPKIIRNFTAFADFEAKIKKKESEIMSDKNKANDTHIEDDFTVDGPFGNFEENYDSEEELQDEEIVEHSPLKNDKFKYVISMLIREIRESFLVVYAFCEDSRNRLRGPENSENAKSILKTAEETHHNITQLFSSLNRLYSRDVTEMERLFAKFLDSAELKDLKLDENDFQVYRDLIGKCIDKATSLRDSVECIMRYAV